MLQKLAPPPQPLPTQDEGAQVGLQAPELIGVILQLFLCDPPGVTVGVFLQALLVQPLWWGGLLKHSRNHCKNNQRNKETKKKKYIHKHGCNLQHKGVSTRATDACSAAGLVYLLGEECWSSWAVAGCEDCLFSLAEGRKEETKHKFGRQRETWANMNVPRQKWASARFYFSCTRFKGPLPSFLYFSKPRGQRSQTASLPFLLTTKDKHSSCTSVHFRKVCAKHVDLEMIAFVMSQGALQLHRLTTTQPPTKHAGRSNIFFLYIYICRRT